MPPGLRRAALLLAQAALLAGLAWLLLRQADTHRLVEALRRTAPGPALLAALAQGLAVWLPGVLRLRALTRGRVTRRDALLVLAAGQLLNTLLPFKLGEAARLTLLARRLGGDLTLATETTFWERFGDLNSMLLLLLAAGPVLGGGTLSSLMLALALGFWAGVLALRTWGGAARALFARLPWPALAAYLSGVAGAIGARLTPGFAAGLGALSLPSMLLQAAVLATTLVHACGLPLAPHEALAVAAAGLAGQAMPGAPGGLGVFEAAVAGALLGLGQPLEAGLAAALVLHAVLALPKLAAGAWAVSALGADASLRLGRLVRPGGA